MALRAALLLRRGPAICIARAASTTAAASPPSAGGVLSSAVDLRLVRDHADRVQQNARLRRAPGDAHAVARLYAGYGALQSQTDALRQRRRELAAANAARPDPAAAEEGRAVKARLSALNGELRLQRQRLEREARLLPCMSHPDAPVGPEASAREIMRGGPASASAPPGHFLRDHVQLCRLLRLADFDSATSTGLAGAGFAVLLNDGVQLELAVVQWALSRLRAEGFELVSPPDLALASLVEACGFLPRAAGAEDEGIEGDEGGGAANAQSDGVGEGTLGRAAAAAASQVFSLQGSPPLCLVGTGEIPLAGLLQGQLLPSRQSLPRLLAAFTHCFRREAGGGGASSRGLYRLHQFSKVEMFAFAAPHAPQSAADRAEAAAHLSHVREPALVRALCPEREPAAATGDPAFAPHAASDALLCRLVDLQVRLVSELGLHFRVLDMPTEELGSSAHRKVDVEAWMPGRRVTPGPIGGFGEVSSASHCSDFQARRLGVRFRDAEAGGAARFVHTLNATGAAVPRLVLALLETHQQPDGSVRLPACLHPFMEGRTELRPPAVP